MNPAYMQQAIKKAWEGYKNGQEPFGSCIIKNNKVIALNHNTINSDNDPTAHAEMNAIREACKTLSTSDLTGCELYATFKPCDMCMEAIKRSGIKVVYYGAGPENVQYPSTSPGLNITDGIMLEECLELAVKKYPLKV